MLKKKSCNVEIGPYLQTNKTIMCMIHIKSNILSRNPSLISEQNIFLTFPHLNSINFKRQERCMGTL